MKFSRVLRSLSNTSCYFWFELNRWLLPTLYAAGTTYANSHFDPNIGLRENNQVGEWQSLCNIGPSATRDESVSDAH